LWSDRHLATLPPDGTASTVAERRDSKVTVTVGRQRYRPFV